LNRTTRKAGLLAIALLILASQATSASAKWDGSCRGTYRIAKGDTLNKIAKQCGVTLSLLLMSNPQIKNPSRIFTGQVVQLPRQAHRVGDRSPTLVARPAADRISPGEIEALGIEAESAERWIDVDLSSQTVSAYRGHEPVRTFLSSTGTWRTPTITGQFSIYQKFETKDMRGPGYFLKDVPYTMFFHRSYGLHGTYWHDNFGTPMSHGCINLSTEDAAWLFEFASEGTLVNVRY
jgi:lipoprotein-anchoring transpeptidase ErfK/SrfK